MKKLFASLIAVASLFGPSALSADLVRDAEATQVMLKEFGFTYTPHREGMNDWRCDFALRPSADKPVRSFCAAKDARNAFYLSFLLWDKSFPKEEAVKHGLDFSFPSDQRNYTIRWQGREELRRDDGLVFEMFNFQVGWSYSAYTPYQSIVVFTLPNSPYMYGVRATNGKGTKPSDARPTHEEMRQVLQSLQFRAE